MVDVEAPFFIVEDSILKYSNTLSTSSPLRRREGGERETQRERERERERMASMLIHKRKLMNG